jgi:hypothetical protein
MPYINLNRYFNLNNSLAIHLKKEDELISRLELNVLVGLSHFNKGIGVGIFRLEKHLTYYRHRMSRNQLLVVLRKYVSLGYIDMYGKNYTLSLSGKALLSTLNKRCGCTVKVY